VAVDVPRVVGVHPCRVDGSSVKRTISAAGRKRIAAAQRAGWAKVKAGKKK